ncbi:MAG: hypothetical protein CSA65_03175 [Proteobacteria bacterium]|nr:MAG: hypothetical protein CSB49_04260 [Pseudomonadota bacterium]PIE19137.1 MAG: hypothetical protein CSA65_03175 [Pseudomonadota bacterium]
MAAIFPRVYRSFDEFERSELRKLDHLYASVDDMVDEMLRAELDEDDGHQQEDGILFDRIDE